jgi:hypothetical protein
MARGSWKRLTKDEIQDIAYNVYSASRENAVLAVMDENGGLEAVKARYEYVDLHPDYGRYFLAGVEGILDDDLRNPRGFSEYGAPRPLTDAEIARVRREMKLDAIRRAVGKS